MQIEIARAVATSPSRYNVMVQAFVLVAVAAIVGMLTLVSVLVNGSVPAPPPQLLESHTYGQHAHGEHDARKAVTMCGNGQPECSAWWAEREKTWRKRSGEYERERLRAYEAQYREKLWQSTRMIGPTSDVPYDYWARKDKNALFPFDWFEPEYSCPDEERLPRNFGDGPKWMCGPSLLPQPCRAVSFGSNFDASFEAAVHAIAQCETYTVDPTLAPPERVAEFREQVRRDHRVLLNSSVGLGSGPVATLANYKGHFNYGRSAVKDFPLVNLTTLLRDRYGLPAPTTAPATSAASLPAIAASASSAVGAAPLRLTVLKMDIEGFEWGILGEAFELCASGQLRIDQLNVEMHYAAGLRMRDVYWIFEGALKCRLWLHHKEINRGCRGGVSCTEFAWVSIEHAHRIEHALRP